MTTEKATVLCIDDDKIAQKVVLNSIQHDYQVQSAFNGTDGLALVKSTQPDVVLLDVEMPGMNGYEVCDALKHDPLTASIPVIFLSSHSSLRERMQGYEMGAEDYLVKPFDKDMLLAKLSVLQRFRSQERQLKHKVAQAEKTAYTAMSGNGELALVVSFVEKSYGTKSFPVLAELLFATTNRLDLNCSLCITGGEKDQWYSSRGNISPLEQEIITMLRSEGKRIQDFGSRTQINYPHISILIKNMPLNNMDRYGRIKDLLPTMLAATDAKINILNTEQALKQQTMETEYAFEKIYRTLTGIGNSIQTNQRQSAKVLHDMFTELVQKLPGMALEDDQETYLLNRVENAVTASKTLTDAGIEMCDSFGDVIANMKQLSEKLNSLIEKYMNVEPENNGLDSGDSYSSDIELF